ncbi:EexN family lipoprotein [Sphingopyxis sp.]|uniref:EexN family lipoprotein n=1 Tax=Sphingopyxis sp. TaxID=1908224 RepID=UPI002FC766C4
MKTQIISVAFVVLGACGQAEPRAEQYFSAHLDEAKQIVEDCATGTARGEECRNAENAISKAKAKERTKRFLGDGKAYTPLP